jgi:hypothetical protein
MILGFNAQALQDAPESNSDRVHYMAIALPSTNPTNDCAPEVRFSPVLFADPIGDYPFSRNELPAHMRFVSFPHYRVCRVMRDLAIKQYGEPTEHGIPFDPLRDTLFLKLDVRQILAMARGPQGNEGPGPGPGPQAVTYPVPTILRHYPLRGPEYHAMPAHFLQRIRRVQLSFPSPLDHGAHGPAAIFYAQWEALAAAFAANCPRMAHLEIACRLHQGANADSLRLFDDLCRQVWGWMVAQHNRGRPVGAMFTHLCALRLTLRGRFQGQYVQTAHGGGDGDGGGDQAPGIFTRCIVTFDFSRDRMRPTQRIEYDQPVTQ